MAVQHALQDLSVRYGRGLARPWRSRLREVALAASERLQRLTSDALARVTATPPRRAWWRPFSLGWGVLEVLALIGVIWLVVVAATSYLGLSDADTSAGGALALPLILTAVGVVGWMVMWFVRQRLVTTGADRYRQWVQREYHKELAEAVKEAIAPLAVEVAAYQRLVEDLRAVVG